MSKASKIAGKVGEAVAEVSDYQKAVDLARELHPDVPSGNARLYLKVAPPENSGIYNWLKKKNEKIADLYYKFNRGAKQGAQFGFTSNQGIHLDRQYDYISPEGKVVPAGTPGAKRRFELRTSSEVNPDTGKKEYHIRGSNPDVQLLRDPDILPRMTDPGQVYEFISKEQLDPNLNYELADFDLYQQYKERGDAALDGLAPEVAQHIKQIDAFEQSDPAMFNQLTGLSQRGGIPGRILQEYRISTSVPHQYGGQRFDAGDDDIEPHLSFAKSALRPDKGRPTAGMTPAEKVGYIAGRIGADVAGHGTRHYLWNATVNEQVNKAGIRQIITGPQLSDPILRAGLAAGAGLAADTMMSSGSGNFNPLNLGEGGRPSGYEALYPDPNNPRKSTAPALELIERTVLNKKGRPLQWEEFVKDKPNASFRDYEEYKNWMYSNEPGPIDTATLGLVKVTARNPDGMPEVKILGGSVTPVGVAAAGATIGAANLLKRYLISKGL